MNATSKLRPVTIFRTVTIKDPGQPSQTELKEIGQGLFHGFGADFIEYENGPGNYTVAIIELPTGKIEMMCPTKIRFTDTTTGNNHE